QGGGGAPLVEGRGEPADRGRATGRPRGGELVQHGAADRSVARRRGHQGHSAGDSGAARPGFHIPDAALGRRAPLPTRKGKPPHAKSARFSWTRPASHALGHAGSGTQLPGTSGEVVETSDFGGPAPEADATPPL